MRTLVFLNTNLNPEGWSLVQPIKVNNYRPQRSWGKVIFSQASVILSAEGSLLPTGVPAPGGACSGGACSGGLPAPGGGARSGGSPGLHTRGNLRRIRSRPTHKGEFEEDQVQAYTQGGNWGGSGLGPPDGYCCGRYACYWNTFLLHNGKGPLTSMGHVCTKFFWFESISIRNVSMHLSIFFPECYGIES